jgi:hypothetical protein
VLLGFLHTRCLKISKRQDQCSGRQTPPLHRAISHQPCHSSGKWLDWHPHCSGLDLIGVIATQENTMRSLCCRLSIGWCRVFHPQPLRPVHGHYQCPACLRCYPVPWHEDNKLFRREVANSRSRAVSQLHCPSASERVLPSVPSSVAVGWPNPPHRRLRIAFAQ